MDMTAQEFRKLFDTVSNWGRWDDGGRRGALSHLTAARIAAAARLVRSGVTVTLSRPLRTEGRIDVPEPAELARIGRELADLYVQATTLDPGRKAS